MPTPEKKPIAHATYQAAMARLRGRPEVEGADWFGPGDPLPPSAQGPAFARAFDFPVMANTNYTPRTGEAVSFAQLRSLADNYDLLRLMIETRKDQLSAMDWEVKARKGQKASEEEIQAVRTVLECPDGEHDTSTWIRLVAEDLLVIDAPTIVPLKNLLGDSVLYFEQVDGATIKPLLDKGGRRPKPPAPAYQQILKGLPAVDYTTDELIYRPRNPRVHRFYGFSPVEQIIMTVNIALRRQLHQLQYYTEGTIPDALASVPVTWNPDQLKKFQANFDEMLSDTGARRKLRFIPGETKLQMLKEQILKDGMDEWLARIVAFAFGVSPTALIAQVNRATAETAKEEALEQGLAPIKLWFKNLFNHLIQVRLAKPNLEFCWSDEEVVDAKTRAEIDSMDLASGARTLEEVRDARRLKSKEEPKPADPAAAPAGPPADPAAPAPGGPAAAPAPGAPPPATLVVQDTALNGAQITSLLEVVAQAAAKEIPLETARAVITASFPHLKPETVDAMLAPLKAFEKPEPPATPPPPGGQPPPPPPPKGKQPPAPQPDAADDPAKLDKAGKKKIRALNRNRPALRKARRELEKKLRGVLGKIRKAVVAEARDLASKVEKSPVTDAVERLLESIPSDEWVLFARAVVPVVQRAYDLGGEAALRQLTAAGALESAAMDEMLSLVNERGVEWAEGRAAELVGMKVNDAGEWVENPRAEWAISYTTREGIRAEVTSALESGATNQELADQLQDSFLFSDDRASMIARTETAFADVAGNLDGWQASGVVAQKEWVTQAEVCDECEALNGIKVDLDDSFPGGVDGPPLHPNCRCDVLPVLDA